MSLNSILALLYVELGLSTDGDSLTLLPNVMAINYSVFVCFSMLLSYVDQYYIERGVALAQSYWTHVFDGVERIQVSALCLECPSTFFCPLSAGLCPITLCSRSSDSMVCFSAPSLRFSSWMIFKQFYSQK